MCQGIHRVPLLSYNVFVLVSKSYSLGVPPLLLISSSGLPFFFWFPTVLSSLYFYLTKGLITLTPSFLGLLFAFLKENLLSFLCILIVNERLCGSKRDRTANLLLARQALSQLSYGPLCRSFPLSLVL